MSQQTLTATVTRLEANKSNTRGLIIRLGDRSIHFQVGAAVIGAGRENVYGDLMNSVNSYWKTLSPQAQEQIFTIYQEAQNCFDTIFQTNEIFEYLTRLITRLFVHHDIEHIQAWVRLNSNIPIPESVKREYQAADGRTSAAETTREKTYLFHEYIGLIALTIVFKALIPIWGEYVRIARETGSMHKEIETFRLISHTSLYHSEPMEKLRTYIRALSQKDAYNDFNRLSGISSEDYPHYLLCRISVRRLCGFDFQSDANLVGEIYAGMRQGGQTNQNDERRVIEKIIGGDDSEDGSSGNKISTLEAYRQKTDITPSMLSAIEFEAANYEKLARKVCPNVPMEQVHYAVARGSVAQNPEITDMHMTLLKWIYADAISPMALDYVENPRSHWNLCLAAEAILRFKGHNWLALLITAQPVPTEGRQAVVTSTDGRMQIHEDMLKALDAYSPYHQRPRRNGVLNEKNHAAQDIAALVELIRSNRWMYTAEDSEIQATNNDISRRLKLRIEVRMLLAELKLQLDSGSWLHA